MSAHELPNLCNTCPYRGQPLPLTYRLWLFAISAAVTVLIPALLMSNFELLTTFMPGVLFLTVAVVPLLILMALAFIGLYNALFGGRAGHHPAPDYSEKYTYPPPPRA